MQLGPRTLWDLNLAMVIVSVLALVFQWNDLVGPWWGKVVTSGLLAAYMILGFVTSGIRPPPPPSALK